MNTVLILAAIIFAVIFFRVAKLLSLRSRLTLQYLPILGALELALWTAIIFWTADLLLADKQYYPYLIILLLVVFTLLLVWYYVKDIIAGFIFLVRHNPLKGQVLDCEAVKGTIRVIGLSQITIETSQGQWQRVPYSALVTQPLSLTSQHTLAPGETVIKVKLLGNVDPGYFTRFVRESLALSSWCVTAKPITVQPDLEEEGMLRISFFMIDPAYLTMARNQIANLAERIMTSETESPEKKT